LKLIAKEIEAKTFINDQYFSVIKADFETLKINVQLTQSQMNDINLRVS